MLEQEIYVNQLKLKTRLVLPPMATQRAERGMVNDGIISYYRQYALNSGIGLIITEHSYVAEQGKADPNQISFASDDVIPLQRKLTDVVHEADPTLKIFAQISHAGARTSTKITGQELVSASVMAGKEGMSRALTVLEIDSIRNLFVEAARRVQSAGYDGVEIHSAHGYLLNQFYSPLLNQRTDLYGAQTIENRVRLITEIIRTVRAAVGPAFPIAVRLGGCDYQDGGSTIADAVEASQRLEEAGADLIDLSGGVCSYRRDGCSDPGYFSDMSSAVKAAVNVPVLLTGGVTTHESAERLLCQGKADLIGVGRALLRDPKW